MTGEQDLRFTNFIEDADAWVKQLRADKRFSTVTIAGHSEGSLIGMVAAREANADAYVSLEGAGRRASDHSASSRSSRSFRPKCSPDSSASSTSSSGGNDTKPVPPMLAPLFRPSVLPYLVSWFKYDPAVEIAKLTIPVLIVQGSTDIQTSMTDAKALAAANPAARFLAIEGMNHILKAVSGAPQEQMPKYSDPTLPVVPQLLDEVAAFVRAVAKKARSGVEVRKLACADDRDSCRRGDGDTIAPPTPSRRRSTSATAGSAPTR